MVETPTTAACRTERRGYGRQLGINSAAVTLGGNLESNLDRGAAVGATGRAMHAEVVDMASMVRNCVARCRRECCSTWISIPGS